MEKSTVECMTLELALQIVAGVKQVQEERDLPPFNIAVVDASGLLTAFNRQDNSLKGSLNVSMMKAKSSALFQLTTRQIRALCFGENGNPPADPGMICIPGVLPVPGGIPIVNVAGVVVGAVGVSGANDDDDEICALIGIAHATNAFDLQSSTPKGKHGGN